MSKPVEVEAIYTYKKHGRGELDISPEPTEIIVTYADGQVKRIR